MKRRSAPPAKNSPPRAQIDAATKVRAEAFLARAVPDELKPHYVAGSLAETAIRVAASGEAPDGELLEIIEMTIGEYEEQIASAKSAELKAYFQECSALISQILSTSRSA